MAAAALLLAIRKKKARKRKFEAFSCQGRFEAYFRNIDATLRRVPSLSYANKKIAAYQKLMYV